MKWRDWLRRHCAPIIWSAVIIAVLALVSFLPVIPLTEFGDNVLVPVAFWSAVFFCVYYSLLAPWWHNPMGRMLVGLDLGLAAALFGSVLKQEFGVQVGTVISLRVVAAAILLVDIIILSRTLLLGHLHNWVPSFPWRLRRRSYTQEEGHIRINSGDEGSDSA
jgi:hypothetical protein